MSIKRKYDKATLKGLRLLGKGLLKNHVTPMGLDSDFDISFYNHFTPAGLALVSDYVFYNPNTPAGLDSDFDFSFYNHSTPSGLISDIFALYHHLNSLNLLKSRRDDMIIDKLFNKQLNPEGVTY